MTSEKTLRPRSGYTILFACLLGLLIVAPLLVVGAVSLRLPPPLAIPMIVLAGIVALVALTCLCGLVAIGPGDARVFLLFGEYRGTTKESGFFWVNPFYSKRPISMKVRNFETGSQSIPATHDATGKVVDKASRTLGRPSKVNDRDGNPIDISAVVVWKVVNTAEAMFEVDDYEDFVAVQSESALRSLASRYPYDSEDHETSLRGSTEIICDQLRSDLQDRLHKAGVEVIEARLCHLAYSSEIAAAMLQRQQAHAIVAARSKIVEGAIGTVEMALQRLTDAKMVKLDDRQQAEMVSNLLVVLCSDRHVQPVINTSTHN